jgi:hypothetical protein
MTAPVPSRGTAVRFLARGGLLRACRPVRPTHAAEFLTWLWPVVSHAVRYGRGRERALALEIEQQAETLGLVRIVPAPSAGGLLANPDAPHAPRASILKSG